MAIDPFKNGIKSFAADLRTGQVSIEEAVSYYLHRIEVLNPKLGAFQLVDAEGAKKTAKALDALLASGNDLGPLMGVPIGVKDIITVQGLPVTNGSLHPTAHLNGAEGSVIKKLRQLGCVILGKTKTVEFALGSTGVNEARGTPWNPWDMQNHRLPGGSSSGSAVALAAGMCAFSLGTDTGGSVRIPACYNGLFGHKTSIGLWPTDGVFPLSATLDSIGPLCRTVADASVIHEAINPGHVVKPASLKGLRFARCAPVFFDALDDEVESCFNRAVAVLEKEGVEFVDIELPESLERDQVFAPIVGAELISSLGAEEFANARPKMDTITSARAAIGLDVSAVDYLIAKNRHRQLKQLAAETFSDVDAWVSPTVAMLPMSLEDLQDAEKAQRALLSSRNTQLGNLYGLCASTLPIQQLAVPRCELPIGFQLMMPTDTDSELLGVSKAIEQVIGVGPTVELSLK